MRQTRIKHRGNKYVLQVQGSDGKFKQIFSSEKKSEIKRKRADVQSESLDVRAAIDKRTFVQVYEEFYKHKISVAEKSYTAIRYASVKHYKGWYEKYIYPLFDNRVLVSEMSIKHSKDFFLTLRELDGVTWKTANLIVLSFLTVLKFAATQQYIKNYDAAFHTWKPAKDAETADPNPALMRHRKTKMISLQQCQKLYQYLEPKNEEDIREWQRFSVVATLMFAGVRVSELRGLKWDAVKFIKALNKAKQIIEYGEIKIFRTVVGNGGALDRVKKIGSLRTIIAHPQLVNILKRYKSLLNKHYQSIARNYVFPSLRWTDDKNTIPLSDRTITDWIKIAFADLGYAKIKIHRQKNGISRSFVQLLECEFDHSVTRTFRHFYCTAIKNAQRKHDVLTDNFSKGQSGHRDYATFAQLYGDHDNFDTSDDMKQRQVAAIDDAIPIGIGGGK